MSRKEKGKLWTLFTSMLSISAFTFGGGFVIVTLMKRRFVDELGWLEENDMLDMTALAQTCPGAIAVNAAILAGRSVAGVRGIAAAVLGTIIPPVAILSVISYCYTQFAENAWVAAALAGMQAGVAAVIVDVVLNLGGGILKEKKRLIHAVLMGAFTASLLGVNAIHIVLACAGIGALNAVCMRRHQA